MHKSLTRTFASLSTSITASIKTSIIIAVIAGAATITINPCRARAQESGKSGVYIKITDAKVKKSLVAIPSFRFTGTPGSTKNAVKIGQELYNVFRNDLDVSGYFNFIRQEAFVEDVSKVGLRPVTEETGGFRFDSWKQIGAEFLVRVGYRITGSEVTIDTYTYYVPQAKLVLGKSYKADTDDVRTLAHTFANDLIKELTGVRGMFLTKMVVSRSTDPQEKEIFVMDWDGGNAKQITHHHHISISPAWSFDGRTIAYSTFGFHPAEKTRNLDVFTYDLSTGKRFAISYRRGINSGAFFMPDNKHLVLTISQTGASEIYRSTLDGRSLERLTNSKTGEINVEPAVSPDGKKIAYSSDKSGYAMVYIMDADGKNSRRLTFAGKFNSSPAWSPDGKRIAFAGYDKDHFDIFVVNVDGTNMIRLTTAKKPNGKMANNEDPSFSPDGRYIMFRSDRTGKYQIYIVTADGETERRVSFDQHDYFKPRWSPFFE